MKSNSHGSWIEQVLLNVGVARVGILFVLHAAIFTTSYVVATMVRYEFSIPAIYVPILKASLPWIVGVQLLVGAAFGFYRGWWRYVGVADVIRLVIGISTATALLGGLWYGFNVLRIDAPFRESSRGVLLIDYAFVLLTLFAARLLIRVGRDRFRPAKILAAPKRVIIIGAGDAGETLAREIEHRPQLGMRVVAFVDDQRAKWGSLIRGVTVSGPISNIEDIVAATRADEALIAIPSASGKRMREIILHLSEAGLPFKTMPGIDHLVSGKVQVTSLRPVNVEDLLRRKQIELPGDRVRNLFRGKRVVVTGAGGTIGSELASQILRLEPACMVLVERSEYALYEVRKRLMNESPTLADNTVTNALIDIQQPAMVRNLLRQTQPDVVLHAAAHKHVPLGEENPAEYVRNNALATKDLAEACEESGVGRFVLISTDKAINPTSAMGASKRAAEILLLDVARRGRMKATVVRFGNVIGSSGSVIPLFMEQIASGGPVTVTHPQVTRYFLRTSEAVSLVLQAAVLGRDGEVFMLDMGEPVKIVDLARDLIHLSNQTEEDIPIVFTGLRPGEKLFEEVRLHDESARPTIHPQIVVTLATQPDRAEVEKWCVSMRAACESGTDAISLLSELIPEYAPPARTAQALGGPTMPIRRPADAGRPTAVVPPVKEPHIASAT